LYLKQGKTINKDLAEVAKREEMKRTKKLHGNYTMLFVLTVNWITNAIISTDITRSLGQVASVLKELTGWEAAGPSEDVKREGLLNEGHLLREWLNENGHTSAEIKNKMVLFTQSVRLLLNSSIQVRIKILIHIQCPTTNNQLKYLKHLIHWIIFCINMRC
jgi:hypothetical protein